MKERPILFAGPMVRAILRSGAAKTQTRRIVRLPDWFTEEYGRFGAHEIASEIDCPQGAPGDRLWVRETWQAIHTSIDPETGYGDDVQAAPTIPKDSRGGWWSVVYAATDPEADDSKDDRGFVWRPGIHMPRWASRLTLEVAEVRVQRLQDITYQDIEAEGAILRPHPPGGVVAVDGKAYLSWGSAWIALWDSINGQRAPWASNPWVWVIEFKRKV